MAESRGVNFTEGGIDIQSDLDWGEIENIGTSGELRQFLRINGGAQDYGNFQTATDVGAFEISANGQIARCGNGEKHEVPDNLIKS